MSQDNYQSGAGNRPQRPMFDQENQGGAPRPRAEVPSAGQGGQRAVYRSGGARPAAGGAGRQPSRAPAQAARRPSQQAAARRRKKSKRRVRAITIAVCLLLILAVGLFAISSLLEGTLRNEDIPAGSIPEDVGTEDLYPEYEGKDIINILICGVHKEDSVLADGTVVKDNVGNTDVIMYLSYNTTKSTATMMQIPRDVFVGAELDAATAGTTKINGLWAGANDEKNRIAPLIRVLADQYKLPVDAYITLDMEALKAIMGTLPGPLKVYVPQEVTYQHENGKVDRIPAGWQDIDAANAEFLLRNRNYFDADISRLSTQLHFYAAVFRLFQTASPSDLVKYAKILVYYAGVGGLDMVSFDDEQDVAGLAIEALSLTSENITIIRPSITGAERYNTVVGRNESLVCLVPDEFCDLLNEYFRPDGHTYELDELNIPEPLPVNYIGKSETSIKTMADVESSEGP